MRILMAIISILASASAFAQSNVTVKEVNHEPKTYV